MEKNLNIYTNEDQETIFLLHAIKNCSLGTIASPTRDWVQDLALWCTFMCTGELNIMVYIIKTEGVVARSPWASSLGALNCENQNNPVSNWVESKGQHPRLFSDVYKCLVTIHQSHTHKHACTKVVLDLSILILYVGCFTHISVCAPHQNLLSQSYIQALQTVMWMQGLITLGPLKEKVVLLTTEPFPVARERAAYLSRPPS